MKKAFLQQKAHEDVRNIALYIAEDKPEAARAFRVAIENTCETLGALPEMGSVFTFADTELEGLRMLPLRKFKKYLIFYRINTEENVAEIVRIIHGARDIPSLFEQWPGEDAGEQKAA